MVKILVIEDEPPLLEEVVEILRFENFETLGASNGVLGLEQARRHRPDLIICDIIMPELDGYSVLYELRQDPLTADMPFIFLTARIEKNDRRAGMELGADDYLTKPFTHEELLAAVGTQLEKRATRMKIAEGKLDSLREQIITALPHELRTPLTGILGYSEILADADTLSPVEVRQLGQLLFKSAQRLRRLVENYLTYVQIELISQNPLWVERLRAEPSLDVADGVQAVADKVAYSHERLSDLQVQVKGTLHAHIHPEYLAKIAEELIDNAFKFSPRGTPVIVALMSDGRSVAVQIQDAGRGLAAEQIEQVGAYVQFDRKFYEQQGSGMGLIIAKRLVELHGGRFIIDSIPGQGTTVGFHLPCERVGNV
jgi:signal transduction histidine kinase